jgi:2-amino-4-hydroxy-6-hydroxymethyldihydropteridine diphosphokinase
VAHARIGLGSNLGDAAGNVEAAIAALAELGTVRARSSLYRTRAWGVTEQPDFVNAAVSLETECLPRALLGALKALELRLGRQESYRWGPRTIDLDILAYDALSLREPDLVIPHEHLHERAFALAPLAEIDASFAAAYGALPAAERATVQRIPGSGTRSQTAVNWDESLERVRSAAEFCASAGLARLRIDEADVTIEMRRTPREKPQALPEGAPESAADVASTGPVFGNGAIAHDDPPATVLKAEFVGIVRLSRPSVSEGSILGEDRELAFVESLGIRNPVRSGGAGRIARVFVTDGQAVEYGQPLFAIET